MPRPNQVPPPRVYGCIHCGEHPARAIEKKQDGCIIIERYCESCLEPSFFKDLQEWYSKF